MFPPGKAMAGHQGRVRCSEWALAARLTPRGRNDPVRIERNAPMRRSVLAPRAIDALAPGAEKPNGLDRAEVGEARLQLRLLVTSRRGERRTHVESCNSILE
jgi:hypothetical protein